MAILYIHFKPGEPTRYRIIWKKTMDASFPIQNYKDVDKVAGLWNIVNIDIDDEFVDWTFAIMPICNGLLGAPLYGIVPATCRKVAFTGSYDNCLCPSITNINYDLS